MTALSISPWLSWGALAAAELAPRLALVIGNGTYPGNARLGNPTNDATSIAQALRQLKFDVNLKTDCTRQDMDSAVRAFCAEVARQKAVALFYFAGHGMQIDWRNYLLPVDIKLASAGDVPRQTMDVATLMDGLGKAGGPMNIVILDACRDNPFGVSNKTGAGLSQMDAPSRTILAYATAPGNVASDGAGTNGLYTENLLQEMVRPEARIEDVFKRTRLSVRLKSQGKQIPWESTSLEDDFFFLPPARTTQLSQNELDALFEKDEADWKRAQKANTALAMSGYLKVHPNGHFCEIAQATLDRLLEKQGEKKIRIQTSAENPFSKGSAEAGRIRLGDRYVYRQFDRLGGDERRKIEVVTSVTDAEIEFNHGKFTTDLLGNTLVDDEDGDQGGANQIFCNDFAVGKEWRTRFDDVDDVAEFDCKVVGRETITVPAGKFDAFKVEAVGWRFDNRARRTRTYWIAPDQVPRFIAFEKVKYNHKGQIRRSVRQELMSFTPGQG
nr:caspase family protein [Ralstonia insidiosa]